MPPFTLRVVRGIISALPLASADQRRHKVASAVFASIHAKPSPMHLCAPPGLVVFGHQDLPVEIGTIHEVDQDGVHRHGADITVSGGLLQ